VMPPDRVVNWFFLLVFLMNVSAMLITGYMINAPCNGFCVYETNPIPAFIYANFGIAGMFLVIGIVWLLAYEVFEHLSKKRIGLRAKWLFLLLVAPVITVDFARNVFMLFQFLG